MLRRIRISCDAPGYLQSDTIEAVSRIHDGRSFIEATGRTRHGMMMTNQRRAAKWWTHRPPHALLLLLLSPLLLLLLLPSQFVQPEEEHVRHLLPAERMFSASVSNVLTGVTTMSTRNTSKSISSNHLSYLSVKLFGVIRVVDVMLGRFNQGKAVSMMTDIYFCTD